MGGSIVKIGVMWADQRITATAHSGFSVQKGGLHSLTKALSVELVPATRIQPMPCRRGPGRGRGLPR